jgi:hypothetical protein
VGPSPVDGSAATSPVDGSAATALDLLGQVLACIGHGLVGEGDQIDRDSGAGKPHPKRLAESRGGNDRHNLHGQPPGKRAAAQPVPDALVLPATTPRTWPVSRFTIVVIQGSNRVQVFDSGSWKSCTDRNRCSSMPSILGLSLFTSGSRSRQASSSATRTIQQKTAKPTVVSDAALPDRMTASTRWSRGRLVERSRRGNCGVDSKNDNLPQAASSPCQRYLDQSTSTGPATGISRIRWKCLPSAGMQ